MTDFLSNWALWLGLGGGIASIIGLLVILRLFAPAVLDFLTAALLPAVQAAGNIGGDVVRISWENFRDGALYISKSGRAVFAMLVFGAIVAVSVYVPTKHATAKKTWAKAHHDYTLIRKRAPKTASNRPLDVIRRSLGGY